jgi:hypothetical protein
MAIEKEYYVPLYRLAVSKIPEDYRLQQISEWLAKNALKVSNQAVRESFKRAGRKDLVDVFLQQEDISVNDVVKSRSTGRFGTVVKEHWDGETVTVKWDSGGQQPLSKGSLFKIHEKKEERLDKNDVVLAKSDTEAYEEMTDKKKQFIEMKDNMAKEKKNKSASEVEYETWVKSKLYNESK